MLYGSGNGFGEVYGLIAGGGGILEAGEIDGGGFPVLEFEADRAL